MKLLAFYGTKFLFTVSTTSSFLFLSQDRRIQSVPSNYVSWAHFNIIFPSTTMSFKQSLSLSFSFSPYVLRAQSLLSFFRLANAIWHGPKSSSSSLRSFLQCPVTDFLLGPWGQQNKWKCAHTHTHTHTYTHTRAHTSHERGFDCQW